MKCPTCHKEGYQPPGTYLSGEGYRYVQGAQTHTWLFKRTKEFRPPKKGEWYLSGAIPEAYYAPNDLSSAYHILVRVGD